MHPSSSRVDDQKPFQDGGIPKLALEGSLPKQDASLGPPGSCFSRVAVPGFALNKREPQKGSEQVRFAQTAFQVPGQFAEEASGIPLFGLRNSCSAAPCESRFPTENGQAP